MKILQKVCVVYVLSWVIIGETGCNPINPSQPGNMSNKGKQASYLQQFGYMKKHGAEVTDEAFSKALQKFQKKWGLQETGEVWAFSYFLNLFFVVYS